MFSLQQLSSKLRVLTGNVEYIFMTGEFKLVCETLLSPLMNFMSTALWVVVVTGDVILGL
jgi:hypothetical protein